MKFTVVKEIPERTKKKKLLHILDEFMNMNVKYAKFEFNENEYKTASSANGNLRKAANNYGYPITVRMVDGVVYFERRDI